MYVIFLYTLVFTFCLLPLTKELLLYHLKMFMHCNCVFSLTSRKHFFVDFLVTVQSECNGSKAHTHIKYDQIIVLLQ